MSTNLIRPDPKLLKSAGGVTLEEDRIGGVFGPLVPSHVAFEDRGVADIATGLPVIVDLHLGRRNFCLDFNFRKAHGFVVCLNRLATNMDWNCRRLGGRHDNVAPKELRGDKASNIRLWDLLVTHLTENNFHQGCDAKEIAKLDGDLFTTVVVAHKQTEGEHSGSGMQSQR